jgi:membrane protein EpsK
MNIVANLANFALNVAVGILFTPYLIRHLGVASFGIIPLVTTVTSYLAVCNLVLNASVGRYVTLELERGNHEEASRFFNTSLFGSLGVILLLLGPALVVSRNPELLFRIPAGDEIQARWFFLCTIVMFLLSVASSSFEISSFCRNRFDLRNIVAICGTLTRVGLVVLLFSRGEARLWHVGAAVVLAAVVTTAGAVALWSRLTPELRVNMTAFDRKTLATLAHSGGWVALNQGGTILLLSIDLLVINRLFGPVESGRYATLLQWSALLRGAAGAIAVVLAPTIIYHYARLDIDSLVRYARSSVRYLGLSMALPVGLVSGLSRPLLQVWLGPDFASLAPLLTLMTVHLCINLCYLPLHNIATATNDVRLPGLIQIALGTINLLLCLLLAGPAEMGMYGVALAGALVITLKNAVFTPLFSARIIGRNLSTFYREALPVVAVNLAVFALCHLLSRLLPLASWPGLMGAALSVSILYGIFIWSVMITKGERQSILNALPFAGGSVHSP